MVKKRKTGIECPSCKDRIFSWHRHDWRGCKCGKSFVDGGDDYLRYGYAVGTKPRVIRFCKRDVKPT